MQTSKHVDDISCKYFNSIIYLFINKLFVLYLFSSAIVTFDVGPSWTLLIYNDVLSVFVVTNMAIGSNTID